MKALFVVKSVHHLNTLRVAEAMADVIDARIVEPAAATRALVDECDLLGLGSGVYFGMLHSELRRWAADLPSTSESKPAIVFTTSGLPFLRSIWHAPIRRRLQRLGYQVVGEFGCRGFDTVGPLWLIGGLNRRHPDQADLDRARRFAESIAARFQASATSVSGDSSSTSE